MKNKFLWSLFPVLFLLTTGLFLMDISPVHAVYKYTPMENIPGFEGVTDFPAYVLSITKFVIWAVGITALFMITVGGFMYMTSAGNTSRMDSAKKVIFDALIGLIVVLGAWLLLYVINPDLVKVNISFIPMGAPGGPAAPTIPGAPPKLGTLATGCGNYESVFNSASGGDKNLKCLLIGIANQETGCNPNLTSSAGACGLMQIMPATAGTSCEELLGNPEKSITLAANYLKQAQGQIPSSGFDIGKNNNLSGTLVTYGNYKYDTGNDDLIASYNAGYGKNSSTLGKKGPFALSSDCLFPPTPAWQCNVNPGGFSETQGYVVKVQSFQSQCLAK